MDSYDIVCVQEHWLAKQELNQLNNLHSNFLGFGVSPVNYETHLKGRNYGGVGIVWKQSIESYIQPLQLENELDWMCGLYFNTANSKLLILNVYLPCDNVANVELYLERMGVILSIIQECDTTSVLIVGDFNSDILDTCNDSVLGPLLIDFCNENNLLLADKLSLPPDTYTFVSDVWGSVSWLDHAICTQDAKDCIRNIYIDQRFMSDHLPLVLELNLNVLPCLSPEDRVSSKINSGKVPITSIHEYAKTSDCKLKQITFSFDDVNCLDCNCSNKNHIASLEHLYDDIVNALMLSSDIWQRI